MGCDGILVKPFEPQLVISRVEDLLAGRQPAGMWSSAPPPRGPVRQAPQDSTKRAPTPGASGPDPLEAYFDQLDAAFSSAGTTAAATGRLRDRPPNRHRPSPRSSGTIRCHAGPAAPRPGRTPVIRWLAGSGSHRRPASGLGRSSRRRRALTPAVASPARPRRCHSALPASLVDAFTALLSAGKQPVAIGAPPPRRAQPDPGQQPSPTMIDAVAERVRAKLSTQSRPAILDVAERLVREEIERLKQ